MHEKLPAKMRKLNMPKEQFFFEGRDFQGAPRSNGPLRSSGLNHPHRTVKEKKRANL